MKFKDFYNEEMMLEMAYILKKRHIDMPCNTLISAMNNSKQGPRIKIQNNNSTNLQPENMFSMSIPDLKITGIIHIPDQKMIS